MIIAETAEPMCQPTLLNSKFQLSPSPKDTGDRQPFVRQDTRWIENVLSQKMEEGDHFMEWSPSSVSRFIQARWLI
jgi:hypothetical protein